VGSYHVGTRLTSELEPPRRLGQDRVLGTREEGEPRDPGVPDFLFRGNIIELAVALAIAAAVFFFIVKPVRAMVARRKSPVEEGMADEERRHQELLAALGRVGSR
jgi:hypothetical protein